MEMILIQGESMLPTITDGGQVGITQADGPLARGDIAIIRGEAEDLCKRVIGLPGDRVEIGRFRMRVNGQPWPRRRTSRRPCGTIDGLAVYEWTERTPEGRRYRIRDHGPDGTLTGQWTVGPDEVFVLGDHRADSEDSRNGAGTLKLNEVYELRVHTHAARR